jgi:hypothetical protein
MQTLPPGIGAFTGIFVGIVAGAILDKVMENG